MVGPTSRWSPRTTFACSPPVSRHITFHPGTSWLLLPWQASPPGKVRGDAANPMISRPGRLHTSEISILLLVSSAVAHHCHHRPLWPFQDWHPFTKPVLILTKEINSTFVPRFPRFVPVLEVWYFLKVSPSEWIVVLCSAPKKELIRHALHKRAVRQKRRCFRSENN